MKDEEENRIKKLLQQQFKLQNELQRRDSDIRRINVDTKKKLEEQLQKAEQQMASKVDVSEVDKLQDQFINLQIEIERQKAENYKKIKEKEALIEQKIKEEQEREDQARRKTEKLLE